MIIKVTRSNRLNLTKGRNTHLNLKHFLVQSSYLKREIHKMFNKQEERWKGLEQRWHCDGLWIRCVQVSMFATFLLFSNQSCNNSQHLQFQSPSILFLFIHLSPLNTVKSSQSQRFYLFLSPFPPLSISLSIFLLRSSTFDLHRIFFNPNWIYLCLFSLFDVCLCLYLFLFT